MRWLFAAFVVAAFVLSGCSQPNDSDRPEAPDAATLRPGQGLDASKLSEDKFGITPSTNQYVPSSADGVLLHVETWLPDGPGPWPTILENSPYNGLANLCQEWLPPCDAGSLGQRYVPKGYAVVYADVRGTANSEGCMDMMGAKEQHDTYDLVEWIAAQPWSDGNVGMQGVSYVGTTPHEALIESPPHLKAVATVAGVTNQWRNMYQNGVPYQGRFYPLTYEALTGLPPPLDIQRGPAWALNVVAGACEQGPMVEEVQPLAYTKGVYDEYWAERNFTAKAHNVTVPLLYSQGFIDRAVNPMEAIYWFNDVQGPKKAFFHQDGHQYVDRDDYFDTELAWFDHYLKGIDNGVDRMPVVEVITNTDKIRLDDEWPPHDAIRAKLYLSSGKLTADAPAAGDETYFAPLVANVAFEPTLPLAPGLPSESDLFDAAGTPVVLDHVSDPLDADLYMAGNAVMHLVASSDQTNTYFLFELWDWNGGEGSFVQEGWFNAHLREGFDHSAPLSPGTSYNFTFKFEPRDYVFEAGHQIGIRVKGIDPSVLPFDTPAAMNTIQFGPEGSFVELPVLDHPKLFERDGNTGPT